MSINVICPWQNTIVIEAPWGVVIRAGFDQKRHPKGSSKGGRFAREDWALDTSVPPTVNSAMTYFQTYNRTRAKYNRAKRSGIDPARTERLKKTLAMTKAQFEEAQRKALNRGVRINKLGKWTNQEVDQRLLKEAASVRTEYIKRYDKLRNDLVDMRRNDPEYQRLQIERDQYRENQSRLLEENIALRAEAEGRGLDPNKPALWADNDLLDRFLDVSKRTKKNSLELMAVAESQDAMEKRLISEFNREAQKLLRPKDSLSVSASLPDDPEFARIFPDMEKSIANAAGLVSQELYPPGTMTVGVKKAPGSRSYALGDTMMMTGFRADGPRAVAHEFGHVLSYKNHNIRYKANQFLKRRAGNERPSQISGHPEGEVGIKDDFIEHYMGKIYGSLNPDRMYQMANTEIISMGLERLATDPVNLMQDDPEYFDFIYAIMRGG